MRRGLWNNVYDASVRFVARNPIFATLEYSIARFAYRQVLADRRRAKKAKVR